jgi:Secretion system C-terminal sorting domain
MKRTFILLATAFTSIAALAQLPVSAKNFKKHTQVYSHHTVMPGNNYRTTAAGDTIVLKNTHSTDVPVLYYAGTASRDSGYLSGIDVWGDQGFAERYDFNAADSNVQVLGVMSLFGGKVNPASTKTVVFNAWSVADRSSTGFTNVYNSGLPDVSLNAVTVPITHLGISNIDTVPDTFKTFFFPSPTAYLKKSFFVGYTIAYDPAAFGGDTIGLYTSSDGDRTSSLFTISGTDTIINNQNVTMFDDGLWYDNASDNAFLANNLYIYPVVKVRNVVGVQGVTKKGLTFFGNYPNPASSVTNIRLALNSTENVEIIITDMNGRTVLTKTNPTLSAGEHTIPVDVSSLSAGEYVYIVRTNAGNGIASKLTVVR